MSKQKKKRNKRYQGEDAKTNTTGSAPVVHRYQAVQRGPVGEWWHRRKRVVKPLAITVTAISFVAWLLVELFRTLA